jgi:hypothetical protein
MPMAQAAATQLGMRPDGIRTNLLFTMSDSTRAATEAAGANFCFLCGRFVGCLVAYRSFGGARRNRTDDLMLAKHALSQLSYGPRD